MSKRKCSFQDDWTQEWEFIKPGEDKQHARCTYCRCQISVAVMGRTAISAHLKTSSHKASAAAVETSERGVFASFEERNLACQDDLKATAAEMTLVYHTVSHAKSYKSLDCTGSLEKALFPDSKIATKLSCGKTKGEAVSYNFLAPYSVEKQVAILKQKGLYFSVATDGSPHKRTKCFPILLNYFNPTEGMKLCLVDFYEEASEDADRFIQRLKEYLNSHSLELGKVCAYSADNTKTNFGCRKGTFIKLKELVTKLVKANCKAHVVHNCAKNCAAKLQLDVENFVLKTYSHFSHSALKTDTLKEFYEFEETEWASILRHVSTRWLSLLPAIDRILKCWEALKSYFLSQDDEEVAQVILDFFGTEEDEMTHGLAYLLFFSNILKVFYEIIGVLEQNEITIVSLHRLMLSLLTRLEDNLKNEFFGYRVNQYLRSLPKREAAALTADFKKFLELSCSYLRKWYDFGEGNVEVALQCLSLEEEVQLNDLFKCVTLLKLSEIDMDELYAEYLVLVRLQKSCQNDLSKGSVYLNDGWKYLRKPQNCRGQ